MGPVADLGGAYLLTVATLEPRKNLGTLVDAFGLLADTGLSLVVAGGSGWGEQPELDRPGIVRLGRVTDDELARLYRGAAAVVYPSRFEGFGMPVTEAMASGAPVVVVGPPFARRGCRRRSGARRSREPAGDRRGDPRGSGAPRRAAGARARARHGASPGGVSARSFVRGTRDSHSARHDAARPDARRYRALRTCAPRRPRRRSRRASVPGDVTPAHRRCRRALVSAPASPGGSRRVALPDLPRSGSRDSRTSSSPSMISPCCGTPSGSTAGRRATRALRFRGCCGRRAG